MSIFRSRYDGTCTKCGKPIKAGQYISWVRGKRGIVYHADCARPDATPSTIPSEPAAVIPRTETAILDLLKKALTPEALKAILPSESPVVTPVVIGDAERAPKIPKRAEDSRSESAIAAETESMLTLNSPWYELFEAILPHVDRVLLVGPPGTGKSTTAAQIAECKHRVTMTETTPVEHLLGQFQLVKGETVWIDGPVTKAMRNGEAILFDEIDRLSPEVASVLYELMDDAPYATLASGEEVRAKEGYKVILTSNEGIDMLPPAVQDRVQVIIPALTPHPAALAGIDGKLSNLCVRYYSGLPKGNHAMRPTIRRTRMMHSLVTEGIPTEVAAFLVYGGDGAKEIFSTLTSIESDNREAGDDE